MALTRISWDWTVNGDLVATHPNGNKWAFALIGDYIYCDMGDKRAYGSLGAQICEGGALRGYTLTADDNSFERTVKKWLRDYRKDESFNDFDGF